MAGAGGPNLSSAVGSWVGAVSLTTQGTGHLVMSGDKKVPSLLLVLGGGQMHTGHFLQHPAGLNKWHQ